MMQSEMNVLYDDETLTMSKPQLKKLAKQKMIDEKRRAKNQTDSDIAPTADQDYKNRLTYTEEQRQKFATLYQPPLSNVYANWTKMIKLHFKKLNKEEMIKSDKQYSNELITVLANVGSCRATGKMGFLTMYFPPEDIYDSAYIDQLGIIVRPEIQVLIRPQEFEIATIKQKYDSDDKFPGLPIPIYHIESQQFENDGEKESQTIAYIKHLTRQEIRVFDQYYIIGYPGYSNTGERTIYAKNIFPVSINHMMVNRLHGAEEHQLQQFSNTEIAYRNPLLRWMYDTKSIHTQFVRSKFQTILKDLLTIDYSLMELDVPHLMSVASGRVAAMTENRRKNTA